VKFGKEEPQKTVKFVEAVPKTECSATNCAHRNAIKPCNFQKLFGNFLYGMICMCVPMFKFFSAPPDGATTEYQISNRGFSDFLTPEQSLLLQTLSRNPSNFSIATATELYTYIIFIF